MIRCMRKLVVVLLLGLAADGASARAAESLEVELTSGKTKPMTVIAPTAKGIRVKVGEGESLIAWDQIEPISRYEISARFLGKENGKGWLVLGDYCLKHGLLPQAERCYKNASKFDPDLKAQADEKLVELRGEQLEGTISVRIKKLGLSVALTRLGRAADMDITLDDKLADKLRTAPRDKRPVIEYEKDNVTAESALNGILGPLNLQHMDTPKGLVVYSRKIGIGPTTENILIEALNDSAVEDRVQAASALGCLGAVGAVGELCRAAKQESPRVRLAAVLALNLFRDPLVLDTLFAALQDPVRAVQEASLDALASRLAAPNLVPQLIACTQRDDREIAKRAASLLGQTGTPDAAAAIREALSAEKMAVRDHWARRHLIRSLARLGDTESVPLLREWIDHKDAAFRRESVLALATLGDRQSISPILSAMKKHEKDWTMKEECCRALVRFGGDQAVTAVLVTISNQEDERRKANLLNLFREAAPDPKIETTLIDYLGSDKDHVARAASETLGIIGTERAIEPLMEAMRKRPKTHWVLNPLRRLTGQRFGYEMKEWNEWWGKNKETYKGKR